MEAEKTEIIDICKYFIDLIFVDGEIFTLNREKFEEKNEDEFYKDSLFLKKWNKSNTEIKEIKF